MSVPWYRPASFYLLRVPTLPSTLFATLSQNGHIDLSHGQDLESAWQGARQTSLKHIAHLAASPLVEQALLVASPRLYEALSGLHQQKGAEGRRALRAYERLLRYLMRMSSRPTPFGYCAGVAFGSFATESHVALERFVGAGIRPDMHWLLMLVASMETRFLSSLEVQVTPSLLSFGKRGIGLKYGKDYQQDERAWFKMVPVFHRLCHYARMPIPYADLKQALLTDFPQATGEQVETFLHELYHIGVLLTTLPPADQHDPLSHVLSVLRPVTEASAVVVQLEAIEETIHSAPLSIHGLSRLLQQQRMLTPLFEETTIQVDTRIHLSQNTLSNEIGREAAKVTETLLRLGMYTYGLPSLHHARRTFLERYEEQEVPLLTLFAPQGGFDTLYEKESDLGALPREQQERIAQRACLLRTLAMQAVNAQKNSLALTPDLVERLSLCSPSGNTPPPPLLDLYMQVYAASTEAIDRGDWQGLVTLLSLGGRSYRRFLHLFGEQEQAMVRDMLQAGDALSPEHLCATLAVLPPNVRDLNVMHGPLWSAYVIPINRPSPQPPEQTIFPDDLLVSVRKGRFCLRSRFHNKAVRVTQHHMLSFLHLPPLARFLLEASRDEEPFPGPFQWGKAGTLPFLPRLTLGKIIVSLAQWTLSQETLESRGLEAEGAQWFRVIQHWREQWRVPRYVYLVDGEDRLLLDLEHPLMVDILRQELVHTKKPPTVILQESFFHESEGWIHDEEGNQYASEIVIPLVRTTVSPQPSLPLAAYQVISDEERRFLPGQQWLFLKLYLPEGLHRTVLADPLPSFVQRYQPLFDGWYFSRYYDPEAHIRVRFHQSDEHQRAALLQALLTWCQELQREGLLMRCTLDTYDRETERYGGPTAIATIESVFCANSEAVCALLAGPGGAHPPLFEVVYALDRLWSDWGYDLSARYHALQRFLPPGKESQALRKLRQPLLAFLGHPPEHISCIFDKQRPILVQVGRDIRHQASQGVLWRTEEEILWSLSHMLCNRLLGTSRQREQEAYAAWYVTLKVRYHLAPLRGGTGEA